jgi:(4S)-4-hydroxy-5-phosphonooxypentane-2,3-dione isomerase
MFIVFVKIQVVPEKRQEFIEATKANHLGTRQEPGNLRFDVLQHHDDPNQFSLYEVYHQEIDFIAHQKTSHYLTWKETAAPLMASPRTVERFNSLFPEPWE